MIDPTQEGYVPAAQFLRAHLPAGVESGHALLYSHAGTRFTPSPAQLDRCLRDYQALVTKLVPAGDPPLAALARVMAFEMMDANELVLAFLRYQSPVGLSRSDRGQIVEAIKASVALVDSRVPELVGQDFYKRYASLLELLTSES